MIFARAYIGGLFLVGSRFVSHAEYFGFNPQGRRRIVVLHKGKTRKDAANPKRGKAAKDRAHFNRQRRLVRSYGNATIQS
jgi:hypothetical protein